MARLTERRFHQAEDILEKYRERLFANRAFEAGLLEKELRDLWDTGYRDIKDIMIDLSKMERFESVAVFYMEHSNAGAVVSEFQDRLAELYGIDNWYHSPDREEKQKIYWENVFQEG